MSILDFFHTRAVPAALVTVLRGNGLSLTVGGLKRVVVNPKAVNASGRGHIGVDTSPKLCCNH